MVGRRLERTGVLLAGSAAVGVHAGLAPEHLAEWAPLGSAFVAAAVGGSLLVAALAVRPDERRTLAGLGALLSALIAGYVTTRLVAVPPLDPQREPFDLVGVATTVVEAIGLLLTVHLISQRPGGIR